MSSWMNNPWVVGIVGGILSGLLVTFVTRKLLSRKDRGEHVQKLRTANREIVYALRPGISEGHVPDRRVVESLINATARRYAVDKSELHDPVEIGEELAKEIMDSSFISAKVKQEYFDQLKSLTMTPSDEVSEISDVERIRIGVRTGTAEYRSRTVAMASVVIGFATTLTVLALAISSQEIQLTDEALTVFLPAVTALSSVFVVLMLTYVRNKARGLSRTRHREEEASRGTPRTGQIRDEAAVDLPAILRPRRIRRRQ